MGFPDPLPGLVIRYAFLWADDYDRGADEASKDRPCAIVLAAIRESDELMTIVAAITHAPPSPANLSDSLELPAKICQNLGFDDGRHWVRLDQLNRFVWPGYDLRARPDAPDRWDYGMLPKAFFERLRDRIVARSKASNARQIPRD